MTAIHPRSFIATPPKHVVFDLRVAMQEYEAIVAQMNELVLDIDGLLNDIVNHLRYSFFYPGELVALVHSIVAYSSLPIEEDVVLLERAIMVLGNAIHGQFMSHRFYDVEHTHHYQYEGLMRGDGMVLRLVPYYRQDY